MNARPGFCRVTGCYARSRHATGLCGKHLRDARRARQRLVLDGCQHGDTIDETCTGGVTVTWCMTCGVPCAVVIARKGRVFYVTDPPWSVR